ncbi:MAG: hypothetical protein JWN88_2401, partial [Frankiales bacterium]|nr:hypothetical protein [Frankiales bacterium]
MICSFECTFCAYCLAAALRGVCPHCGGGLSPRPVGPSRGWRVGTSIGHYRR